MRDLYVLPITVFFDTGSIDCHDLTFNIGQHAIGVTAATTRSFTIKVSSGTKRLGSTRGLDQNPNLNLL